MNEKRIRQHLRKVLDDFTESIKDEEVKEAIRKGTIITGGAITSLLQSETPKDYDLYFKDKETVLLVARYFVDKFNEKNVITNKVGYTGQKAFVLDGAIPVEEQVSMEGEDLWYSRMLYNLDEDRVKVIVRSDGVAEELPDPEDLLSEGDDIQADLIEKGKKKKGRNLKEKPESYRPVFLSTNAITLSDRIQLILRFYGTPDEIHKTYDFCHCCNYWTAWDNKVTLDTKALECIINKELVYRGSLYPLCSVFRIRKFLARGWKINAGQILKMGFQLSTLDLTDIDVLEDQLIGVDTLYFAQFIKNIREAQNQYQEQGRELQLTPGYVDSIVDKIFG